MFTKFEFIADLKFLIRRLLLNFLCNYFAYTPLLPSVTVGIVEARRIVEPIRSIASKTGLDFKYREAECFKIDPENKKVYCKSTQESMGKKEEFAVDYDYLVVAMGARVNTFNTPGVVENAHFLKEVEDAQRIHRSVVECFERANLPSVSDKEREKILHFVVGGGGPTRVEFAAELHDFVHEHLAQLYSTLKQYVKITLLEAGDHILSMFDNRITAFAEENFKRDGIELKTASMVVKVTDKDIVTKERATGETVSIPYGMVVWSTGICSRPVVLDFMKQIGQGNRRVLATDEWLRVEGTQNIYALGDCATINQRKVMDDIDAIFKKANKNNSHAEEELDIEKFKTALSEVDSQMKFLPATGQVAAQEGKASRVINISEDIFAGFSCTLRGGNVTHHEYVQVGKGRDVGLNQIAMFEAKVGSGNGEQVLSREVYRLGHRLDFSRMLSFFYTTVGFFLSTTMIILTVCAFLWSRLYLALSGIESSNSADDAADNKALGAILNQQFILQLGLFTALPMIVENSLENGFLSAIWDFITMQLQLSSVFFTFSMGTRAHYFGRTILHGGAKYRATGRGFVAEHKSFAENYRLYARSHFVKAIELGLILVVYASYSAVAKGTFVYIALTISSWFLVISWMMAPFLFNPSGFDWLKTVYDFDDFINWIWFRGGVFAKADQGWERWWYEEQDHLRTTGLWGKFLEMYGVVYQLGISDGSNSIFVYLLSWIYVGMALAVYSTVAYARDKYAARKHIYYRLVQFLLIIILVLVIIALLQFTEFKFLDIFTSLLAFLPTGWGFISIAQVLRSFLGNTVIWETVVSVARMYDILFGVIVMTPVAVLSWLPGFQSMQTRILFNEAFSRGLQINKIVTGKKSSDM